MAGSQGFLGNQETMEVYVTAGECGSLCDMLSQSTS